MDTASLPKTRADAVAQGAKYYFTGLPCKHGHVAPRKTKGACLDCLKAEWEQAKVTRADYFAAYNRSEKGLENKKRYYAENKDAVVARAAAVPIEQRRVWKYKHKTENVEAYKTLTNLRRRRFRDATPPWITKEQKQAIRRLYLAAMQLTKTTGERYVVDHIVPIHGEAVCGLHVPWNLRVITQEENLKKSNKLLLDE
jgi:5-methylcytosine-specific restriction endonuclease McrA